MRFFGRFLGPAALCLGLSLSLTAPGEAVPLDDLEADHNGLAAVGNTCPIHGKSQVIKGCKGCNWEVAPRKPKPQPPVKTPPQPKVQPQPQTPPRTTLPGPGNVPTRPVSPTPNPRTSPTQPISTGPIPRRPAPSAAGPSRPTVPPTRSDSEKPLLTDDEEKAIAVALGVMGGVGALGYAGYLALQALGLAKAGKAVQTGVAAAEAGSAAVEATSGTGEGVTTQPAEPEPTIGSTRTYLDDSGTRWVEVFNGQNWVDSATHAAQQQQSASNQAWQAEQMQRQIDHDTAFDRERVVRRQESLDRLAEHQAEAKREYKDGLREMQEIHLKTLDRAEAAREWAETKTEALEWSKSTADFGVQAVASFTGPVGWVGGNAYTMVSELAQGVSKGVGDAASLNEAVETVGKEAFNGLATGLCKVAVGETLNAAGAGLSYGVRTVAHRLRHFNPGKAPLAPVFHSPLPGTELVQMARNARGGNPLTEGVTTDFAEMGVEAFRRTVSGANVTQVSSGLRTTSIQATRIAHQINIRDVARAADSWGALQGLRGVAVDDQLGQSLAENLFHLE